MHQFLLRRLLLILLILVMVSLLVFIVTEILPGDAASALLGPQSTPAELTALRLRLGLDRPAPVRYLSWVGNVLRGDWGESLTFNLPVGPILLQRMRNSFVLAALALLGGVPLGIGLGIIAGLTRGGWPDRLITIITFFAISFPAFVTANFLLVVFSAWLHWLPASSLIDPQANLLESARYLVLPTLTLMFGMLAHLARQTRNSLIGVLGSDYLRTARSKGLPQRLIITRHALRNALLPTISVVALQIGWLMGGVVLVESVFAYPGLGRLMLQAISSRDLPLLQAVALLVAALYALANLAADLLYGVLNPQIRYI